MSLETLFPHLRGFRLLSFSRETRHLVLTCERVTPSALCPVCGTAAHRIHSRYQRTIWDLSVQNVQVLLHLHVRKFYCDQPDCRRRIFTERLPQVTSPHVRFTFALRQFLGQLGGEQGGASAARSATLQGMQVTARAILRFMHAQHVAARWKQLTKASGEAEPLPEVVPASAPAQRPRQSPGEARYQQMLALREAGLPTKTIAKRLGVEQRTIQRWLAEGMVPMLDHANHEGAHTTGRRDIYGSAGRQVNEMGHYFGRN